MAAVAGANPNYGIGDPGGSFVGIGAMTRACNVPNALQPTIPGGGLLGPDGYVPIWSNPGYDITPPVVSGALGGSGSTNSGGDQGWDQPFWMDPDFFKPEPIPKPTLLGASKKSGGTGSAPSFGGSRPAGGLGIAPDLMKKGKKSVSVKKKKSGKKPKGFGVSVKTGTNNKKPNSNLDSFSSSGKIKKPNDGNFQKQENPETYIYEDIFDFDTVFTYTLGWHTGTLEELEVWAELKSQWGDEYFRFVCQYLIPEFENFYMDNPDYHDNVHCSVWADDFVDVYYDAIEAWQDAGNDYFLSSDGYSIDQTICKYDSSMLATSAISAGTSGVGAGIGVTIGAFGGPIGIVAGGLIGGAAGFTYGLFVNRTRKPGHHWAEFGPKDRTIHMPFDPRRAYLAHPHQNWRFHDNGTSPDMFYLWGETLGFNNLP